MAEARTHIDSLGIYLSDPEGLGGARADMEFWPLEPVIEPGIPSIVIEHVSAACGEGQASIMATGVNSLKFAAPGEAYGEAVTVAANTSALLESETPGKAVRVYRDAVYNAADLSGSLNFRVVRGINNSIGMANETVAGGTRYGCVWLHNHSALPVTSITVTGNADYDVALEVPTAGLVQHPVDDQTAPSGVTFAGTDTAATLAAGESLVLRFRRSLTAPSMNPLVDTEIQVDWTWDGDSYNQALPGRYRVSDPALAVHAVYLGEDAEPDFDLAPAASGTLPLTTALAPGHSWRWVVREVNEFGLSSQNTLSRRVVVGPGGEDGAEALTDPEVVSIASAPGGEIDVRLRYNGIADTVQADTFRLYVGANVAINGDDPTPDPETDTPIDTEMVVFGLARPDLEMVVRLGPYPYGTPVALIARVYSSALEAESGSMEVHTATVTTQAPVGMHQFAVAAGGIHGAGRTQMEGVVYYDAPTNSVGIKTLSGETVVFGSSEAFRAAFGSGTLFRTRFSLSTVEHFAAGSANPIEAISADEVYLNVAGIRLARIDFVAGVIEAAAFTLGADRIDLPVIGPIYATGSETNIMVRNSLTGRWTPALRVDDSGRLTVYLPYRQEL